MTVPRIHAARSVLLVVDVQQKLLPHIASGQAVADNCARLIRGCTLLDVPVLLTEQYPQGLGPTVESVRAALPPATDAVAKLRFSACVESIRDRLATAARPTVLVCGIEAHVCVMQTVLDLVEMGLQPAVVADAVGSRRSGDCQLAIDRMRNAGALSVSVEMTLLEMAREAGTPTFKSILPLIR